MSDLAFEQFSTVQSDKSNLPNTIASAATITPQNFLTFLTGTTQLATINPPVSGVHMLALIFTNATPGAFVTTGNLQAALQPIQNLPLLLIYDPISAKYWGFPGTLT